MMTASLVMDPHPSVLHPGDTVGQAVKLVMEHRYRNLPVVDENGLYLGVFDINVLLRIVLPPAVVLEKGLTTPPFVTDGLHDLYLRLAALKDKPILEFINEDAVVVNPDTPLVESLLALYHTRTSIPVVVGKERRLAGMISYWDVGSHILAQES